MHAYDYYAINTKTNIEIETIEVVQRVGHLPYVAKLGLISRNFYHHLSLPGVFSEEGLSADHHQQCPPNQKLKTKMWK